ncbi:MAG: EAL domain-containing response regulator [Aquisalimonadaceae bacterium]
MERRLLILDDDPLVGDTMQRIAEFAGVAAQFVTDHVEFFQLVEDWQPSHIALDLVMPDMDGVEVMRELERRGCSARIIITSGVGSRVLDAAGRSAAEHGLAIAGVLAKPFSSAAFRKLLRENGAAEPGVQSNPPDGRAAARKSDADINAGALEKALAEDALYAAYQPKVNCRTGQLAGFEALARWKHPAFGLVPPDHFIPLAERSGLIDKVTEQIFGQALRWFGGEFRESRSPAIQDAIKSAPISLSLNLSAKSLVDSDLVEKLDRQCQVLRVPHGQVVLELTETSAMGDPTSSLDLLTRLRMKGFQLSIDDFGTGYSSMLQLVRLPFSEIKIDKSFVGTARHSQESRAVIRSVISLGHSLGLRCTAEGVEDSETLALIRKAGCDFAQGFLMGSPMSGNAIPKWVERNRGHWSSDAKSDSGTSRR